jgi:TPR repeat protein
MYAQGVGVLQSNETAIRYFEQGEGSGDGPSLNGLGYMHLYGMGLPQSVAKATKYFHKAAHEKGETHATPRTGRPASRRQKHHAIND